MSQIKTHMGFVVMPDKPGRPVEVVVDLLAGYVVIRDSAGKRLRSWPASEARVKPGEGADLLLTLGKEEISFETEHPMDFVKSLDAESRYSHEMTPTDRMNQATRMGTVHFGKEPDEPDSPAETPPPDPASRGHYPLVKRGKHEVADPEELLMYESPRALLEAVQPSVVHSIQFGMRSWFSFYLLIGEGTGQERLLEAILGLREASDRLRDVSDRLEKADDLDPTKAKFLFTDGRLLLTRPRERRRGSALHVVDAYRRAVDVWAEAMSSMARGIELDQQHLAGDGFALLADAADIARRVVRVPIYPNLIHTRAGPSLVGESLAYLAGVSPPARVSKVAARRAKQPWERSIIAAGSPFRRL